MYQKYLQQNKRFFRTRTSHFTINFIVSKCTINLNLNTKFSHTFSFFFTLFLWKKKKVFRYTFAIFTNRVTYFARFEKRAICSAFKMKWRISRHRNFSHLVWAICCEQKSFFFRTIDCRQSFLLSTNTFACHNVPQVQIETVAMSEMTKRYQKIHSIEKLHPRKESELTRQIITFFRFSNILKFKHFLCIHSIKCIQKTSKMKFFVKTFKIIADKKEKAKFPI